MQEPDPETVFRSPKEWPKTVTEAVDITLQARLMEMVADEVL